jgi:predicted nucleic-acid-binding Zn-ribbon protein
VPEIPEWVVSEFPEPADGIGETHWRDWIAHDIVEWDAHRSVTHHLSAYGGMGSLDDLYLSATNYTIAPGKQPWLQAFFEGLRSISYVLAKTPASLGAIETWLVRIGTWQRETRLQGWKCRACGYAEVTPEALETFVARHDLRPVILDAFKREALPDLARTLLSSEPAAAPQRETIAQALEASGIEIRPREGWMRPCPKCGSSETEVSYWRLRGNRFEST